MARSPLTKSSSKRGGKEGEPSKVPALRTRLEEYKEQTELVGEKPMVVLAAADDGKTQRFVDVVNALASVKIQSITMTGFRDEK